MMEAAMMAREVSEIPEIDSSGLETPDSNQADKELDEAYDKLFGDDAELSDDILIERPDDDSFIDPDEVLDNMFDDESPDGAEGSISDPSEEYEIDPDVVLDGLFDDGLGGSTIDRPEAPGPVYNNNKADISESEIQENNKESDKRIPRTGGEWSGEPGNSEFKPDPEVVPGDRNGTNPDHKTWGEIMDKYGIDSIPFKDGEPDFSEISKGDVEIDDFSSDRSSNFDQADEKLAEQRGCTPEEVAQWRKENRYTWHECGDCKTMQKVPTEVHGNIPHSGGISEQKKRESESE